MPQIFTRSSTVTQKKLKPLIAIRDIDANQSCLQVREAPADEEETPIAKRSIQDYDFADYCKVNNVTVPTPLLPKIKEKTGINPNKVESPEEVELPLISEGVESAVEITPSSMPSR